MAQNLLDHSAPLDINLTISDELAEQVYEATAVSGNRKSRIPQLQVLLTNLISNHITDPDLYTAVALNNNFYNPKSRYNSQGIGKSFISLVKAMADDGWLEFHRGFFDRSSGISRRSRIKPTHKLLELLEKLETLSRLVAYAPNTECIILRNEDKQDIPYEDTDLKQDVIELGEYGYRDHFVDGSVIRNNLTAYNNLLYKTLIDHPTFPVEGVKMRKGKIFKINHSDKFVRRIYNRSSFDWNGRFYGGWWQRIPKKYREGIHIDGQISCEVDYSSCHIVILYALAEIDYWKQTDADPYLLDEYVVPSEQMRDLLKVVVLVAVNAKSRTEAIKAIRDKINRTDRDKFSWFRESNYNLEYILDLFIEKHKLIADRFFNPDEISISAIDAAVAEIVINKFTQDHIPLLTIHDSFLTIARCEEKLREAMIEAFGIVTELQLGKRIDGTKIKFEGSNWAGYTHRLRTDRDFFIDEIALPKYTEEGEKRIKDTEKHKSLVGDDDYYV